MHLQRIKNRVWRQILRATQYTTDGNGDTVDGCQRHYTCRVYGDAEMREHQKLKKMM